MLLQLLFVSLLGNSAWAQFQPAYSAFREPNTSHKVYMDNLRLFSVELLDEAKLMRAPTEVAKGINDIKIDKIVDWQSDVELNQRFAAVRDERFLKTSNHPNFLRRASWLYPDDGCFARAGVANSNFWSWKVDVPNKIFVFGDLIVNTNNAPGGSVSWWYHVAPLVRVGNQPYVLDPAIEPRKPLPLMEWLQRMTSDVSSLTVAVCESGTYTPNDDCETKMTARDKDATSDQEDYLKDEWQRLVDLNRNPEQELGDFPPWLN